MASCRRCHGYGHELNPDPSLNVPPFIPCRDCTPAEAGTDHNDGPDEQPKNA